MHPEHDDAGSRTRGLFDGARIAAAIIGAADQHELPVGLAEPCKGGDEIELALLLVDACDRQEISALCQPNDWRMDSGRILSGGSMPLGIVRTLTR